MFFEQKLNSGRKRKRLSENPGSKTKSLIWKEKVVEFEEFAESQNVSNTEALNSFVQECYKKWKVKLAKKKVELPVIEATALIYNVNLSIGQYQAIRSLCLPFGLVFPPRNKIDAIKGSLHPEITSHEMKASVNLVELLDETAVALANMQMFQVEPHTSLTLLGKFGLDGSGGHKIRQQSVNEQLACAETPHLCPKTTSNYILSCYVPLEMKTEVGSVVWKNPLPNSIAFARPISLVRAPEKRETIDIETKEIFELLKQPINKALDIQGLKCNITYDTKVSMVDGKMVSIIQGDSGAFCHYCTSTRTESNSTTLINIGFFINKNYSTCKSAWEKLSTGLISSTSSEKQGQCHPSLIKGDLYCFSILHFKIRSLYYVQKVLYHIVGGIKTWSLVGKQAKYTNAKQLCIKHVAEHAKLKMDSPCGNNGNTNTGPLASRFFDEKNRDAICSIISCKKERDDYKKLLELMNAMLTLSQSVDDTKLVDVYHIKDLGIQIMLHIRTSFIDEEGNPWVMITNGVHQLLAHSWELFLMNNGRSIGKWSESPLEAWNKHIQSFKSGTACRARQVSMRLNLYDVFRRMLVISHPTIASRRHNLICSVCGLQGHSSRSLVHHPKDSNEET